MCAVGMRMGAVLGGGWAGKGRSRLAQAFSQCGHVVSWTRLASGEPILGEEKEINSGTNRCAICCTLPRY